ncbi:MAG: Fe-S cluster assembly protein NifU [Planctomycetota bacterium]|nr:Fe-S cluster assembly protein NifU [Planctomycetota bacterium]
MWDYTDKVKDHFRNPRNVGVVENPDGVGEVGSLACGDMLKLTFKLDSAGRIDDVKFQTFGCASAIASSSALTELIKGMTLDEAEKVTNKDIANYLGGLPAQKMHCSVMGREALQAAIRNCRTGETVSKEMAGRVVCTCFGVTEHEIERLIRENDLTSVEDVTNYCKAGGGCGNCRDDIARIISRVRGEPLQPAKPGTTQKRMTNIQRIKLIKETIEREIRPALRQDGGDIELIDVEGPRVLVSFRGACAKCRTANFTIATVIEPKLREFVSDDIRVEVIEP